MTDLVRQVLLDGKVREVGLRGSGGGFRSLGLVAFHKGQEPFRKLVRIEVRTPPAKLLRRALEEEWGL